mmetsp:Transcript_18077/g.32053  ORF Transcript_18077/g.32053 Transcript_18077/m.32053 type:complete len:246 (-) Transcript_18077:1362-2099(-)
MQDRLQLILVGPASVAVPPAEVSLCNVAFQAYNKLVEDVSNLIEDRTSPKLLKPGFHCFSSPAAYQKNDARHSQLFGSGEQGKQDAASHKASGPSDQHCPVDAAASQLLPSAICHTLGSWGLAHGLQQLWVDLQIGGRSESTSCQDQNGRGSAAGHRKPHERPLRWQAAKYKGWPQEGDQGENQQTKRNACARPSLRKRPRRSLAVADIQHGSSERLCVRAAHLWRQREIYNTSHEIYTRRRSHS